MAGTLVQMYANSMIGGMLGRATSLQGIDHKLLKGELRELFVSGVLESLLTAQFAVGSGVIVNQASSLGLVLSMFDTPQKTWIPLTYCMNSGNDWDRDLGRLADEVEKRLGELERGLHLVINDIDLAAYKKFRRVTPHLQYAMGGREVVVDPHSGDHYTRETAEFCLRFLMDTAVTAELKAHEARSSVPSREDIGLTESP